MSSQRALTRHLGSWHFARAPVVPASVITLLERCVNSVGDGSGFMLGLVNVANNFSGLQIGLLNIINSKDRWPVIPLVNWSF